MLSNFRKDSLQILFKVLVRVIFPNPVIKQNYYCTVMTAKSDSGVIFCLQLLG